MALILDSDTALIRDTALDFFAKRAPVSALRKLRDDKDALGFSLPLWRQMAELGWAGFLVPEAYGGADFGCLGLGQVMEAAGRTLAASPLLATALIGASALALAGSAAQKEAHLPALARGQRLVALALEEGAHHAPARDRRHRPPQRRRLPPRRREALRARRPCRRSPHRRRAHRRRAGRAPRHHALPRARRRQGADAHAHLHGRQPQRRALSASMASSSPRRRCWARSMTAPTVLDPVLDRARAGLAAEMLGSAAAAFERTVQYLKDRKQFGVPIGSFQALKHRAAAMFCEIELARSAVIAALAALDAKSRRCRRARQPRQGQGRRRLLPGRQ